jgi:hypothetical protein
MSLPLCAFLSELLFPPFDELEERGTYKYLSEGNIFPENIFQEEDGADQGEHAEREDHQEFNRMLAAIVLPEISHRSSRLV